MSIDHCLDTAVAGGELSSGEARRLKGDYERFRQHRANGSDPMADATARRDLLDMLTAESAHKRRKAKLAMKHIQQFSADITSYRTAGGERDIAAAVLHKLENFGEAMFGGFSSVAGRQRAISAMAHAKMEELLHHFRRGALGGDRTRWNKADQRNLLREAFGEDTGDASARALANSWKETAEWLRQRFNAAGGAIGKIENWGMPQRHDRRALLNTGLERWKDDIRPRLDIARMKHPLSGKPVTAKELDGILDEIWNSVVTDGWNRRDPSRAPAGRGALANQHAEHRFLVFKDADSWLEYQTAFGGGSDPFAAMMAHVNVMARDIAAMEILGPNPTGTMEWARQAITREANLAVRGGEHRLGKVKPHRAIDKANRAIDRIDAVWASLRGDLSTPVDGFWANTLGAVRSVVTASILGQAAISALSDVGTQMVSRRFAGINATGTIPELVDAFRMGTRREAVRAGLILDGAMNAFHAQARYVGTLQGPEWANYLADRVLTWSGLTPWTQGARHAFGLAFQAETASRANLPFEKLPDAFRRTFERYGISARDWDRIRQAPIHQRERGGGILRPSEIAERIDERLAERYLEMILQETEFAVPNHSNRSRTILIGKGGQPGTFWGEVMRSFSMFKSFGAVIVMLHGLRTHRQIASGGGYRSAKGLASGAAYAGSLFISTATFGALSIQLKQIAGGRDPRDMTTPQFGWASIMQGGGLGIYGDFLFSDINRHGGGFSTTLGGPVIQRANDLWNLTAGNAIQRASGETTHFGRELVRFAKGNIPGGNIWYMRLGFERMLLDQLQFLADPEAHRAFRRQQQFWQRNFGQDFWWAPGAMTPQRAPDMGAAIGR